MDAKENLKFYEQLREVPQNAQKPFNNGRFSGTDINPMWRIKRMTEIFGPCGIGWYYEIKDRHMEKSLDGTTLCTFISINLFVKVDGEWSKPIYGEGGNTFCEFIAKKQAIATVDDAYKMALTDAFSNATKQLGLGANVWFENDKIHSTKYDQKMEAAKENSLKLDDAIKEAEAANDMNAINAAWDKYKCFQQDAKFRDAIKAAVERVKAAQPAQQPKQEGQQ